MSLKGVHLFLIVIATLTVLGFAVWCFQQYQASQASGMLMASIGAALLGLGLGSYGAWFARGTMGKLP